MKRLFDFLTVLKPSFFEKFGFPTIKIYSDYAEVYFDSTNVIRDLSDLMIPADEFRMFPNDGCITYVYTFYLYNDNQDD